MCKTLIFIHVHVPLFILENEDNKASKLAVDDNEGAGGNHEQRSACISPASSQGGIYPVCGFI